MSCLSTAYGDGQRAALTFFKMATVPLARPFPHGAPAAPKPSMAVPQAHAAPQAPTAPDITAQMHAHDASNTQFLHEQGMPSNGHQGGMAAATTPETPPAAAPAAKGPGFLRRAFRPVRNALGLAALGAGGALAYGMHRSNEEDRQRHGLIYTPMQGTVMQ